MTSDSSQYHLLRKGGSKVKLEGSLAPENKDSTEVQGPTSVVFDEAPRGYTAKTASALAK